MSRTVKRWLGSARSEAHAESDWTRALHTLRPAFDETKHSYYVDVLFDALSSERPPNNIAVAGAYGSGKSSVLEELRRKLQQDSKVVQVSLASLNQSKEDLLGVSGEESLTSLLQKEIVKRLLYSAKPSKLPKSGFVRISGVRLWRATGVAVVASSLIVGFCLMLGIQTPFVRFSEDRAGVWETYRWLGSFCDWVAIGGIFVAVQALFSTTRLSEIGFGGAKLSLTQQGGDHFDRYLEEIVYFFAKTKTRIVIFEDLDRFDDPGIFRELRGLNSLLNGSPHLRRPISFVYAIRDSIFEREPLEQKVLGGEELSEERVPNNRMDEGGLATDHAARIGADSTASDRAKFFDLVVPLVPFISHEVSADLILEAFSDVPEDSWPSKKLMSIAGKHITDMRVIHNIRNEYAVFTAELFEKSSIEGMKDRRDELFAMVLYKHLYPLDFERIRTGESKLDKVITLISEKTQARLAGLDAEIASLANDIERSVSADRRAEEAGKHFVGVLSAIMRSAQSNQGIESIAFDSGSKYTPQELSKRAFWEELKSTPAADLTVITARHTSFKLQAKELAFLLGEDFRVSEWLKNADQATQMSLTRNLDLRERLAQASISDRISDAAFSGKGTNTKGEPEAIDMPESVRKVLEKGLALDLMARGYIDQNFALFTTKFHGQIISPAARTYMMQHVDRHLPNYRFKLSPAEVVTVLERTQDSVLDDPSVLNLSIVEYLLDKPEFQAFISVLLHQTDEQIEEFVLTYVTEGADSEKFVEKLTPAWSETVNLVAKSERISDSSRRRLFSAALPKLAPDVEYRVSDEAKVVLRRELESLPSIGSDLDELAANTLARFVGTVGHRFEDLASIRNPLRQALAVVGAFRITRVNLEALVSQRRIGIDSLVDIDRRVGEYVVSESNAYVEALDVDPDASSIDNEERFDEIVRFVLSHDSAELEWLLLRAGDALYEDLNAAPEEVYPTLARTDRFKASAANVKTYIDHVGVFDADLASRLESEEEISTDESITQELRLELATAIVNTEYMGVDDKIRLAKSLGLEGYLNAMVVGLDDQDLVVALLGEGLIEDSASTFQALASRSWNVFSSALSSSAKAASFVHEVEFTDERLAEIMSRTEVATQVRDAVISNLQAFSTRIGAKSGFAIAAYIVSSGADVPLGDLVLLANAGAVKPLVAYLSRKHATLSDEDLAQVLNALGTPYSQLTSATGSDCTIPFAEDFKSVLERLKAEGLVKSYRKAMRKDFFRVTMN